MGTAAESVSLEKESATRSPEIGSQQAATAPTGVFDPLVERIFGGAPPELPESAADSLSVRHLKAPVLQRSQRLYGNRASQQIVMRARVLQRQCGCGGTCAKCGEEEGQRAVQRSSAERGAAEFEGIPDSAGEPLDAPTRRPLEAHFGADLTDVRVHTGSEAAKSATSLDALAYTSGHDIYFAAGMYAPSTDSGRRLMAHEVAHVVQQSSGREPAIAMASRSAKIGAPDDVLENEAEQAAGEFMSGAAGNLSDEEQRKRRESAGSYGWVQRRPAHHPGFGLCDLPPGNNSGYIQRVVAEYDVSDQKKLIEDGIRDKDIGKIKDVEPIAFSLATDSQAIDMILILLNQGWVGPRDESAIYNIWNSRGKGVVDLASKYTFIWNMCLDRGVSTIWSIPDLNPVKSAFKQAVAARARGYLDDNQKTVASELKRYGFDNPGTAPTPEQGREREKMQQAALVVKKAKGALDSMHNMLIGYDQVVGTPQNNKVERCVAVFDPGLPPPLPNHVPVPAPEGVALPSWEDARKNYERANAIIDHYTRLYPALGALRDDSDLNAVAARGVCSPEAAAHIAAMQVMSTVLHETASNIGKTYGLVNDPKGDFALELQPIHEQLFLFDAAWKDPFLRMVARAAIAEHGNVEFWNSIGVGAIGLASFVIAELSTGGMATIFFAAAAAAGTVQAAEDWDKYFTLKTAEGTNLSKETALVSRDQASEQLLTAVIDSVLAFVDGFTAVKGGLKAAGTVEREIAAAETRLAGIAEKETQVVATETKAARAEVEVFDATAARHDLKVTETGSVVRCSDPACMLFGQQVAGRAEALKKIIAEAGSGETPELDKLVTRANGVSEKANEIALLPDAERLVEEAKNLEVAKVIENELVALEIMHGAEMKGWLSKLPAEVTEALRGKPNVVIMLQKNKALLPLIEKNHEFAVNALDKLQQEFGDEFAAEVLQKYERVGRVDKELQLLKDLGAGGRTTQGAVGEIAYIDQLLSEGFEEMVLAGDWVNGKKAADLILSNETIVDVKWYNWGSPYYLDVANQEKAAERMLKQIRLRQAQYPGFKIRYSFIGTKGDIPTVVVTKLENAGVEVVGTFSPKVVMPARVLQRLCACGGTCAKCREEEEPRAVQRSSMARAAETFDGIPATAGEPLKADTRRPLEAHFGTDLAHVRVHTGSEAARSATSLDALAYTSGRDIYFATGMYAPASESGQRLLAHEVAHVVQQASGREPAIAAMSSRAAKIGAPEDLLEDEAQRSAEQFMNGSLSDEEQRKKRESGSAVQRFIQRSPNGKTRAGTTPSGTVPVGVRLRELSPAPVMIARQAAERQPFSSSSALHAPTGGFSAQAYVKLHATEILGYLGDDLADAVIDIPTRFVSWWPGSDRRFLIDFWAPFRAHRIDLWDMLIATLAPDSPERAVDSGRDIWPWTIGPPEWQGAVLGELYKLFVRRIVESLTRILPRWLAVKNQLGFLIEGGDMSANREPTAQEVFASHPIDRYVLGALPGKVDIDYTGYRKAFPGAAIKAQIRSGLRSITFDFQMASGAWNWIRVTSPNNATPEEVAKALYGDEAKAYLLTSSPPLFGYPNIDDLLPVHQQRYNTEGVKSTTDPTAVPLMQEDTPATQILSGPLADQAALLQAPNAKPVAAAAAAPAVLDRMRIIVRTLDRIVKEYSKLGSSVFPAEKFQPARDRADRRSRELSSATPAEIAEWDAQSRGQLELVNSAESGMMMAKAQGEAFKDWPSVESVTRNIGSHYARVAQNSDLIETGRALLSFANEQSRLFPVTLMELLLAELRPALAAAHTEKTGVVSQETHEAILGTPELEARERMLRAKLIKVRDIVLQHPEQTKDALRPLFEEIQDLQVEVSLVVNMDACDRAWRALFDATSTVGEMRSGLGDLADVGVLAVTSSGVQPSFEHGNAILRHAMHDALRLNYEWNKILLEYRYGDKKKAVEDLRNESQGEWQGFMKHIRQVIDDQETYDKWMTFALMVGIAILTAGIGTYVETAAGAAWGAWAGFAASTVTEAAAFTSMSYLLVTKDPTVGGFLWDFGKNVATFGGLKIVSRLYRLGVGAEFAASVPGKAGELLVGFAALNGSALYMADREMRAKTGHGLSWSQISDISIGNMGFMIAMAIGAKLSEPIFKDLQLAGTLRGSLTKVENTRLQLLELSEQTKQGQGKDAAVTRRMLDKQGELIVAENEALSRLEALASDPKKASAAGLTSEQAKTISGARGELIDALARLRMARVMRQLESVGPNELLVQKGKAFDEVEEAFNNPPESTVGQVSEDPVTHARSIEIRPKGEEPLVVTERMAAKGDVGGVGGMEAGSNVAEVSAQDTGQRTGPRGAEEGVNSAEAERRTVAKATTPDGEHEIRVFEDGTVNRCSSSCTRLRAFFKELLEDPKNRDFNEHLRNIEERSRSAIPEIKDAATREAAELEPVLRRIASKTIADEMNLNPKAVEAMLELYPMKRLRANPEALRFLCKDLAQELGKIVLEPDALRRVLAKGPDPGNVKGRLWDEVFSAEAKELITTKEGKETLAGGELAPELADKLEFFPGSSITDTAGEELTDGILGWREGRILHSVNIYEAKAGQRAATQLRILEERMARIPQKDVAEIRKLAKEEFARLQHLANKTGKPVGITAGQLEDALLKYRVQKQLGGQVRETIERLDVMVDIKSERDIPTTILLNGEEYQVVGVSGSSRVTGVVPKGVQTMGIEQALKKQRLNFEVLSGSMKVEELNRLAQKISAAAKKLKGSD